MTIKEPKCSNPVKTLLCNDPGKRNMTLKEPNSSKVAFVFVSKLFAATLVSLKAKEVNEA